MLNTTLPSLPVLEKVLSELLGAPPAYIQETPSSFVVAYGQTRWVFSKAKMQYYATPCRLVQYILDVFNVRWENGILVSQDPLNIVYYEPA